ncbi:MAG: peptidoglycan-binding protein LysM [Cellvibrionaceae bacterium]
MGLFSFVTDAGGKLGGAVYDMLNDDEDITKPVTISPERMNEIRKSHIEKNLETEFGDAAKDVIVAVNGDQVTLTGTIEDQATSEKVTLCAGNQHGISTVDCQVAVEKQEPEAQFYTVKSGDTLSKIAKEFYQNAGKYTVIFEANQPLLTDPNKIYPGQTLRIPAIG